MAEFRRTDGTGFQRARKKPAARAAAACSPSGAAGLATVYPLDAHSPGAVLSRVRFALHRSVLHLQCQLGNLAVGRALARRRDVEAIASPAPDGLVIHRTPDGKPPKQDYLSFRITVDKPMTREQFEVATNLQVFGATSVGSRWKNVRARYTPADSPVEVLVESSLLRRVRGTANAAKGIPTDAGGQVAGAKARADEFKALPSSDAKSALLAEINRRYHAATGSDPDTEIKPGETAKSDLWRSIRDEVLFQDAYIGDLPESVRDVIRIGIHGRDLTPADFDQVFRIAKKIESMPPGAAADYGSRITHSTQDLAALESDLERYRIALADRQKAEASRTAVVNKLLGLEEVYQLYLRFLSHSTIEATQPGVRIAEEIGKKAGFEVETSDDLRKQLEAQLARYKFASIAEFAAYIAKFEDAFEEGAARVALDVLEKYAGRLYKEQQRYQDPYEVQILYGKLGGFRAQYAVFENNARIWNDYAAQHNRDVQQEGIAGNGTIHASPPTREQAGAFEKATAAMAQAQATIQALSSQYPIFAEDDLPVDKRLDKSRLAQASENQLAGVLLSHIADRTAVVNEARSQIEGKHELIYKMDKLMPAFYARMDVRPGSIHDMIIRDKMRGDAIKKLVVGIVLAIVAIALSVISFGTATPALVAAGASIGAAGIGTFMALDEYENYSQQHALADASLATRPNAIWLVLAIIGAGVDIAVAVRAMRALGPAADALATGGDLADFTEAVEALRKTKEIDERIAAIAERAGAARKSYAAAKEELQAALGKAYSIPGPFTDPQVYRGLIKMAAAKIRLGGYSLVSFINELANLRLAAKLAAMSPEELVRAKEAFEQGERLARLVTDAALLEKLLSKVGDAGRVERLLAVFPAAELEVIADRLKDAGKIIVMLDHVGTQSTGKLVRQWIADGKIAKADQFLERLAAAEGKELAEAAALGAQSVMIDSNTAIALMKDADPLLKPHMQPGEVARVTYIKSLPPGTELRLGNVAVGETGGSLKLRGVPLSALRDSPEYERVLNRLVAEKVGKDTGFADQALLADAFFAKTDPGVLARFVTADQVAVKKLAGIGGLNVVKEGGFPGLVKKFGNSGFPVTIESRTILVIPVL